MSVQRVDTFIKKGKLVEVFMRRERLLTEQETKSLKIEELQRRIKACVDKDVTNYFQSYVDYLKR